MEKGVDSKFPLVSKESIPVDSFEDVYDVIKPFGKWQLLTLVLVLGSVTSTPMISALVGVTIGYSCDIGAHEAELDSPATLSLVPNDTCEYIVINESQNNQTRTCEHWKYNFEHAGVVESIVQSEWNLVCEKLHYNQFSPVVYFFGCMLGSMIAGPTSDRYGRRKTTIISSILSLVGFLVITFSPNFWTYVTAKFFLGVVFFTAYLSGYVLCLEIVGKKYRAIVGFVIGVTGYVDGCIMALEAYFIPNWRIVYLLRTPLLWLFPFAICYLPESPRWLLSVEKTDEADAVLANAAKFNGVELQGQFCWKRILKQIRSDKNEHGIDSVWSNFRKLFHKRVFRTMVLLCVIWFSQATVYYGLSYYSTKYGGSIYLNFTIISAIAFPSCTIGYFSVQKLGRRVSTAICFAVCSVSSMGVAIIDMSGKFLEWSALAISLGTIGVACIDATYCIMYVYTTELLPTKVRNIGLSVCVLLAGVGSVCSPYLIYLGDVLWHPLTMVIYSSLAFIMLVSVLLLHDTSNINLPESFNDLEMMAQSQTFDVLEFASALPLQLGASHMEIAMESWKEAPNSSSMIAEEIVPDEGEQEEKNVAIDMGESKTDELGIYSDANYDSSVNTSSSELEKIDDAPPYEEAEGMYTAPQDSECLPIYEDAVNNQSYVLENT